MTVSELKKEFLSIVEKNVSRCGIENLIEYLESTDFFKSPASTRYHGSYDGGLVQHSLNVYYSLIDVLTFIYGINWQTRYSLETVTIVSLFHDLCKIDRYKKVIKPIKDIETGAWLDCETYEYNKNKYCMGHAPYSIYQITKFIQLTDEEANAIYWHMGEYDVSEYSNIQELGFSYSRNTLAFALHMADMMSTYIVENENFKPVDVGDGNNT